MDCSLTGGIASCHVCNWMFNCCRHWVLSQDYCSTTLWHSKLDVTIDKFNEQERYLWYIIRAMISWDIFQTIHLSWHLQNGSFSCPLTHISKIHILAWQCGIGVLLIKMNGYVLHLTWWTSPKIPVTLSYNKFNEGHLIYHAVSNNIDQTSYSQFTAIIMCSFHCELWGGQFEYLWKNWRRRTRISYIVQSKYEKTHHKLQQKHKWPPSCRKIKKFTKINRVEPFQISHYVLGPWEKLLKK